jgi:hypothetical protein
VDGRWWYAALLVTLLACSANEQPEQLMSGVAGMQPPPVTVPLGGQVAGPPGIAGVVGGLGAGGMMQLPPVVTMMPVVDAGPPPPVIMDGDGDGVADGDDNCPALANAMQSDGDGDEVGDGCDNCAELTNADQADGDKDGTGDACACANPIVACTAGKAGPYACKGVDLLARMSAATSAPARATRCGVGPTRNRDGRSA